MAHPSANLLRRKAKFTKFRESEAISVNFAVQRPRPATPLVRQLRSTSGIRPEHSRNTGNLEGATQKPGGRTSGLVRLGLRPIPAGREGRRGMARSISLVVALTALALHCNPAAGRDHATPVAHSPWLGIRIVQDGKPVPLTRTDLRMTNVRLEPRPFRILFPKRRADIAYQLCAWTGKSIFRGLRPRVVPGDPNAGASIPASLRERAWRIPRPARGR